MVNFIQNKYNSYMIKWKSIGKGKILLGSVCLLLFYAFMYSDILITTSHGINLWDILFRGEIFDFFEICQSDVDNMGYTIANYAFYDFPIYIIFAIWNFPLWLIRKISGVNIWELPLAMIWAKTLLLVFLVLTARALKKICTLIKVSEERGVLILALYFSSAFLFSSVYIMGQYDIIYIYFMVLALYAYLNNNMRGFLINIAISLLVKPFALFLYAPLILYREKNVIKLMGYTVIACGPLAIFKIAFPARTDWNSYENVLTLFKNKISIAGTEIPIFFLLVFVLYIFCYIRECAKDKDAFWEESILIAFISFSIFFMFCEVNPYWIMILVPFQYLVIALHEGNMYINVLLESIGSVCMVLSQVISFPWCFDANTVRSAYLATIFGERLDYTNNITDIIHNYSEALYSFLDRAEGFLFGLFFAINLIFIYINISKEKKIALREEILPCYIIKLRILVGILLCFIPILSYVL